VSAPPGAPERGTGAPLDLLVIGGGITGAGIAQDAAARGLHTALVERGDFASGTSSKSSKLVHGGLRYLEQLSLGLMYESIAERHVLTRLAPGLVRWRPFLLPRFQGKGKGWKTEVGLWLYDHLACTEKAKRHARLSSDALLERIPALRRDGLAGGALFYDCVTDDARLVLALVLDAATRGAAVYNYVAVEELLYENGKAAGARVRDVLSGESWPIRARQVVAAAGPWTDDLLRRAGDGAEERRIRLSKGVHIVLERGRLDLGGVVLIPSARDRRFLFVIPWYEGIVVGTTDTDYDGDPGDVRPDLDDVDYILDALRWSFPDASPGRDSVISSYAGLRPLIHVPGKASTDVPREYRIFETARGVVAVAGGKLTTFRRMARATVDRVVRRLRGKTASVPHPCWTHRIPLGNPPEPGFDPFRKSDLADEVRRHLIDDYGTWARQIVSILEVFPAWSRPMAPGLPYILAEAHFAVTRERARTLEDVLARRTRVALLDRDQGRGCADEVSRIMANELGWSEEERARQVAAYTRALEERFPGAASLG
jgi:glycerol-3-phosphate dehydrogenase